MPAAGSSRPTLDAEPLPGHMDGLVAETVCATRHQVFSLQVTEPFHSGPGGHRAMQGCGSETPPPLKATAPSRGVRYIPCEVGDRPFSVSRGATKLRFRPRSRVADRRLLFENLLRHWRTGMKGSGCLPHDIRARAAPGYPSPPVAGRPDAFDPASRPCLRSRAKHGRWRSSSDVFHQCAGASRGPRYTVANVRSRARMFSTRHQGRACGRMPSMVGA
jgi:hypothetical protein